MPMNRFITRPALLLAFLGLVLSGCIEKNGVPPPAADAPSQASAGSPADENTAQRRVFADRLLEIATSYETFGRVNPIAHWAPAMCAEPISPTPEVAFSRSTDGSTHGGKLYTLFAKDQSPAGSYVRKGQPSPTGQVIVKESWVPDEVKDDGKPLEPVRRKVKVRQSDGLVEKDDSFLPYARKDGRLYHAQKKGPLFVMFKMDPQAPGTDEGWVYGTVTPDGKQVTSAGRVESCMKCHQDAPHDRLFGLPEEK
jgi:Cytochrome P460